MISKEFLEDGFIKRLKEIVEVNLDNPDFSIEQLCRESGVSRTQLHRKIKAATQLSTSHFIRKIRLEEARIMLERTDLNVSEIAYRTGSNSPQNFSKYFFKEFGLSPSNYRKQAQLQKTEERISASTKTEQVDGPVRSTDRVTEAESTRFWKGSKPLVSVLWVIGVLLSGWTFWHFFLRKPALPIENLSPSIAVIPFQNYGGETDEFLSEGVVEDILTYLTQFKDLKVISRTSTAKFKDTQKSIQEIAEELHVNYILEGSVRQNKQEVRITAQLIRVADDKHIWAHRYDNPKKSLMEIQAEVASDIATALKQSIGPNLKRKLDRGPTENLEAYNAVLRGRFLLRNRTKEKLLQSIDQFNIALQLDSTYSEAYTGKATAYDLLTSLRYKTDKVEEYTKLSEQNVLKAIKYDNTNGLAYGILANIYSGQYRWEESISAFEIALDLSPNDAILNYWFSLTLRGIGDLERALQYHKVASELDPLHPVIQAGYIYTALLAGQFELAEQILDQSASIMGDSFLYHYMWAVFHFRSGAYQAAIAPAAKALELNPEFLQPESTKYYCLGRLNQKAEVNDYLASLDTMQAIDCLRMAKTYMSLDQKKESMHFLKRAADLGVVPEDLLVEPIYASLRTYPDFIAILKQYNFYPYRKNVALY